MPVPVGVIARIGGFCFRHRWWVVGVWLVAATGGVFMSGPVLNALAETTDVRQVESIQAYDVMNTGDQSSGQVIGLVDHVDPQADNVRKAVDRVADQIYDVPNVRAVDTPYSGSRTPLVSQQKDALLIVATLDELDRPTRNATIDAIRTRLHTLGADLPGARVQVGGGAVLSAERQRAFDVDRNRAEVISLPLTLVVLVVVFGGLIAAGLPVIAAVISVASAFPVLYLFTKITDVDSNALTVATLLGLGLSVDYGLLLVARYREELAVGAAPDAALARAWATAGRTIAFSALTVAAALTGLLTFSIRQLTALGAAGVSIAVVAMLVSLTLTAALLGFTKRWIKPSKRAVQRLAHFGDAAELGFFARLSRLVQRRPWRIALITAAVLILAGLPLFTATLKLPGLEGVPRSLESARVADQLTARFGQQFTPTVTVVARTDQARLDAYAQRWASDPAVAEVKPARTLGSGVSRVDLALRGGSQDGAAQALVKRLRADRPPGGQSWVTGDAAVLLDLIGLIVDRLPWAIGVTLVAMVVLLFAFTGSLVVPVKAILANVVSLGATLGVMVGVFEHGWGASVLDTLTVGGLDPFIVVIVFAFAFGLSMDYEVFLLGRIKEYVDRGWDTDTAVRRGLQHTGRIITSAALLMLIVFGCFAAAQTGTVEQIGVGLATAVLIDATVVRCLLVPATMTLLGRWNWWAPRSLQRLQSRIGLREHRLPDASDVTSTDQPLPRPPAVRAADQ
jgi:putative drug exporter of the RND superfamily